MIGGLGKTKNWSYPTKNRTIQSEIRDYSGQGTLGVTKTHYSAQCQKRTKNRKNTHWKTESEMGGCIECGRAKRKNRLEATSN